jgi:hypothetical protein
MRIISLDSEPRATANRFPSVDQSNPKIWPEEKLVSCSCDLLSKWIAPDVVHSIVGFYRGKRPPIRCPS